MSDNSEQKKMAYRTVRYKSASLAILRPPVFYGPLEPRNKSVLVEFKARAQRQGGRNRIDYKAGVTGSDSRFLQGIQSVVSTVIPGNPSVYRSPVRSRLYSAITPGGGNLPGSGVPGRGDRGYRCPEGYQYGGRFTDSRLSTCGQKLFDIAGALGATVAQLVTPSSRPVSGQTAAGRVVGFSQAPGQVTTTRAPQIPRVAAENKRTYTANSEKIINDMVSFAEPATRMVRRDGFALTPVVSAAVLRTVPDNRDMEGANYIQYVDNAAKIGTDDEIGLLSNTGIRKLTYVLPGGSVISIEKARTLTVGERRKLGRTIKTLSRKNNQSDPTSHLKELAAEMGSGIAYRESFEMANPNDMVEAVIPGTSTVRQVRRWYFDSFLKKNKNKKPARVEKESRATNAKPLEEKITNLQNAIRHLNNNGDISKISSQIVAEAVKRSRIYKRRMMKNGISAYDKADGQTLIEISPTTNYQHIGAAVSADIQSYLGLLTPDVVVAGSGVRRPYLLQESVDVASRAKINRDTTSDSNNFEDMLRIAVSDYVADTRDRDLSTIVPLSVGSGGRTVASINRDSSLAGLGLSAAERRQQMELQDFYSAEYLQMMKSNFAKRSDAQRKNAIRLFDAMLERLKEYDVAEMANRLSLDGEFSQAEKAHINLVKSLIETRIKRLSASKASFAKLIGLTQ